MICTLLHYFNILNLHQRRSHLRISRICHVISGCRKWKSTEYRSHKVSWNSVIVFKTHIQKHMHTQCYFTRPTWFSFLGQEAKIGQQAETDTSITSNCALFVSPPYDVPAYTPKTSLRHRLKPDRECFGNTCITTRRRHTTTILTYRQLIHNGHMLHGPNHIPARGPRSENTLITVHAVSRIIYAESWNKDTVLAQFGNNQYTGSKV
jgi:hypothetical protein